MTDLRVWNYVHRWTIARALWNASSAFAFRRLWQDTPQYIIENYSLELFIQNGSREDLDEFAELFLTL